MSVADNQGSGHPSRHGYVKCANCGTWRKDEGLNLARVGEQPPVCFDVYACNRLRAEAKAREVTP